jgi:hypothetical protein
MSLAFGQSEVTPISTKKVPQTIETPVSFVPVPGAYVRFAYARSSDSMANQIEGQDYLCFRYNDQRLAFIVADGVGSSFCGNLAARILGDNLLDWLWSLDVGYLGGAAALTEAAASFLNRIQKQAQLEVQEYDLPGTISPLIRQALEAQRAYGSEAVFVACRIDHPGVIIPDGLVSLFWMGDTRVSVLDPGGSPIDLHGSWDNANRWSTAHGVRGSMSAWMHSLDGVSRVAAFTDGLLAHAARALDYPDSRLNREIALGALEPTSDDVAFIDVVLRTPVYEGYPDPAMPDPNLERPHLEHIWNPAGGGSYELRWTWPGQGNKISYIIQEAANPALADSRTINVPHGATTWRPDKPQPPGHYYYRIRAIRRFGGLTPWSDLRLTRVAFPPPPAPTVYPVEPHRAAVLHWEAPGEALTFEVQQSLTPDFEQPDVVYEGRGLAWAVPTGTPGTYHYRVRAISDGGSGPWSEPQEVVVTAPPPSTPHLAAPSYGYTHGEYELRWQPVPRATHYELEKAPAGGEPLTITVADSIYRVEGEAVGQYTYRVRACHQHGCSEWSLPQAVSIAPRAPDTAPDLALDGPDADGTIRLIWTEVPAADEYLVEVAAEESFANARVYTQSHRTLELTRREPGAYCFRVCGSNDGGEGPWSNVERFAIVPEPPEWIEARRSADARVMVTWAAVGGRVSYRLEMSNPADEASFILVYEGDEIQYEGDLASPADRPRFRVRVEASGSHSSWITSQAIPGTPGATRPTLKPPDISQTGEIRLRWDPVGGAQRYILEMARDPDFDERRIVELEQAGAKFRPPSGGQYWFRVRAVFQRPEGELQGEWSPAVSVEVRRPAAPRLWPVDPVRANAQYEIAWAGVSGCHHYELEEAPSASFDSKQVSAMRIFHPAQKMKLPGRAPGTVYYRIRAVDSRDQSSPWSEVLAVEIT